MTRSLRHAVAVVVGAWALSLQPASGGAAGQWDTASYANNPAINYADSTPSDAVSRLQREIDSGTRTLSFRAGTGYLDSVLEALAVPTPSHLLVFSKTSFQRDLISPENPRTLYFGSDAYVGFIPHAPLLEIASVDPVLGAIFYTLKQEEMPHPRFVRETTRCLQCHESLSATAGVPGLIAPPPVAHIDSLALKAFEHQTSVQNLITRLGYRTRMALAFDRIRNAEIGHPLDLVPPATAALIAQEAEPLVQALLSTGLAPLIDSDAFDVLPAPARNQVYSRLWSTLEPGGKAILTETRPDFAAWRAANE